MKDIDWLPIPLELSSFEIIKNAVFKVAGDTPKTRRALLVCDEVLTNIVSHSGADRLAFSCQRQDDQMNIAFSDNGIPFDPCTTPLVEKEFEFLDDGGMGLSLIRQSVSEIHYFYRDGYNNLYLQFSVEEPHSFQ